MRYLPGVKQTSTSTTTSAIGQTLALSAVTGFPTFASYSPVTDEEFPVTITDGTNMEMGYWCYSAADTLKRVAVLMTWNGSTTSTKPATGIAWGSGTKTIICAPHTIKQGAQDYQDGAALKCIFPVKEPRPTSTLNMADSTVLAVPIEIEAPVMLSGLGVDLTTSAANADPLNLGFYNCNSAGEPGVKLAEISATIALNAATGVKTQSFSANLFVTPGLYYILGISNYSSGTQAAIRAYSAGVPQSNMLGNNTATTNLTQSVGHLTKTGTGHALDAAYIGSWTAVHSSATPCFIAVVA